MGSPFIDKLYRMWETNLAKHEAGTFTMTTAEVNGLGMDYIPVTYEAFEAKLVKRIEAEELKALQQQGCSDFGW